MLDSQLNYGKKKWGILSICVPTRLLISGFTYASFNILLSTIVTDLDWSDTQRTVISSTYATGQLISSFLAGFLFDKFSVKKLFSIFTILLAGISVYMRGMTGSFTTFYISMVMFGVAWGFMAIGGMKILSLWFERKELATANGIWSMSSPIGQILGYNLTVPLIVMLGGWQNLYKGIGILIIIEFVLFMAIYKERGNMDAAISTNAYQAKDTGVIKNITALIKIPRFWILCISETSQRCIVVTAGIYGQFVLQNDPLWGLDKSISGRVGTFLSVGAIVGYFLIPRLVQKFGSHRLVYFSIICGFISCSCFIVGYISYNLLVACILMFVGGVGMGGMILGPKTLMIKMQEVAGPRTGTALSIFEIIGRLSGVLTASLGGFLVITFENITYTMVILYLIMLFCPIMMIIFQILNWRKGIVNED